MPIHDGVQWIWFLAPVLALLGGTVAVTKFAKRQPRLSDDQVAQERLKMRQSLFTARAVSGLFGFTIAGVTLLVEGRWLIACAVLIAGGLVVAWTWNLRNSAPQR